MASPRIDELGERLGIVLRDPEAIRQAFVHSSFLNENPGAAPGHNERLEFLGDAVIGQVVSRLLYDRFPEEDEGLLTARRAALVNRESLAAIALELGLDRYVMLGRGEAGTGGAARPSLLAATFEALAGALFVQEGFGRTQRWLRRIFGALVIPNSGAEPPKSAKSRLQEWTQRHHHQKPRYELVEVSGAVASPCLHRLGDRRRAPAGDGPRVEPPARRGGRGGGHPHPAGGPIATPRRRAVSRLKELRLHGFKTFADPTRFVFERGVTAVIGPNGSGKSNMADAVRWVLGEQSNRSLRTRRADDVIFAGSEARRPQGMAEAILTLDNSDGWLPIDFREVSIGRRAYRSGETEYLINGARSRLRDVVELLAGGRLGANELVVVGQGTVDAALSLRPEERRQLFEEAAGVKNLQVRKNEALGRLARARDNLTRVGDLIGELKPQVRRLAQQAQHQQEHDALGIRARTLVVEVHRRRELAARTALGEGAATEGRGRRRPRGAPLGGGGRSRRDRGRRSGLLDRGVGGPRRIRAARGCPRGAHPRGGTGRCRGSQLRRPRGRHRAIAERARRHRADAGGGSANDGFGCGGDMGSGQAGRAPLAVGGRGLRCGRSRRACRRGGAGRRAGARRDLDRRGGTPGRGLGARHDARRADPGGAA